MSSCIEKIAQDRRKFLEGLDANEGDINLDIFEDFYPDQAHFVFELLQNAEDAGATEATFTLLKEGCRFAHNGKRDFTEEDVRSITGIHNSSKKKSTDQIGKFGVGFKSVFVYTGSPVIHSGDFSFRISRLVLPEPVTREHDTRGRTTFWLPFNNPKKSPEAAYTEVRAGLSELAETTLLFLTNLDLIRWDICDEVSGNVLRIKHSDYHFETLKQVSGTTLSSSHVLKFDRPAEGLEKQRVAVAFALDLVPGVERFEHDKPLARQLRIVPAAPGMVAVFFPAEKETSGLRFHLHAPFVPELSRASIKETPTNRPLFRQLASLSAASLHQIRDLGLLTADFLAALPNPQDTIPDRYKCIRELIIDAMNSEPLTPTHAKGHAPAKRLLQAKASLKELLTPEDLEFLVEHEDEPRQWAIGAAQKNSNADRFLAGLAIEDWDVETFVELISEKTSDEFRFSSGSSDYTRGPDEIFMRWLSGKSPEWHQRLYAVLYAELSANSGWWNLEGGNIVRLSNGEYGTGSTSFFPSDDVQQDDALPRVDRAVYSSGKSKPHQLNAKKFLEEIGVREVGEAEQIEVLLKQRYQAEDFNPRIKDLRRFVSLVENDPQRAKMFTSYFIFKGDDGKWHQPGEIYLDHPFMDTGLATYYGALGEKANRYALAESYLRAEVSAKRIAKFAEAVGARTQLVPTEVNCYANPEWSNLAGVGGERYTSSSINKDYTIDEIESLLACPSVALSKLIWKTMQHLQPHLLRATYQKSRRWGASHADSQLVHHLRNAAWIPQGDCEFVRPPEANRDLLPEGFAFDPGWPWLKAIHFGHDEANRAEASKIRQTQAESLGFVDAESMDRAKRFAALPADEQERILAASEERQEFELPHHEPSNPERRAERVEKQAEKAPEREFEKRTRSVAVGREEVKEEAAEYLQQQYTNGDGVMICQICKASLPFKLDDGRDYFEKVEFLTSLEKRHYQNFLALCPNHAAMYKHANGSTEELLESFLVIGGDKLDILLAQQNESIYFTQTHIHDLKAVVKAETDEQNEVQDIADHPVEYA